jgi:hypothetical protein
MPESRFVSSNGGGLISPSVFVVLDSTTKGGTVEQASGTATPLFGISQPSTRNAPYPSLDDGYAGRNDASQNDEILVYTFPDKEVYLQIGAGGCNPGDRLTSDSNGNGIVTTTTGQFIGAVAKEQGNQGDLVPVDLFPSTEY